MERIHRVSELRARLGELRRAGERIALVPTMGNLHEGHLALVDTARTLVFGGWSGQYFYDELHVLSGMEEDGGTMRWSRPRTVGRGPEARAMHSATAMSFGGLGADDPPRTELVIFGGWAGGNRFLNDTWALDIDRLTWRQVATRGSVKPRPRAGHTAVAFGRQLVVFGGAGAASTYGDLWVLDMDTRDWVEVRQRGDNPGPMSGHVAVARGRHMVVQGGNDSMRPTRLLARLDVDSPTWADIIPVAGETPTSRSGHCGVILGTRVLLFGGFSRNGFLNDLHAFDTAPTGLETVKVDPGEGTHNSIHKVQVVFHGSSPPPLTVQWYRRRRVMPGTAGTATPVPGLWERISGANAMAYLPTADDIGQIIGCCVLPCKGSTPLGPSYMAASPLGPLAIDPEFGEVVKGLVMNTFAEFDVRLLGPTGAGYPHTLQFSLDKITLRRGGREGPILLRDSYRSDFKVVLSSARMNTLVVQLSEGEALPLAVDAVNERDLVALVARSFWALAIKGRAAEGGTGGGVEQTRGGARGRNKVMPAPQLNKAPTSKLLRDYNYER